MQDQQTRVAELRELVKQFVDERDWQPYHTPKNLVMSMSVEMGELMEHFQWRTPEEAERVADDPELLSEISHEIADVSCYLLALCNALGVDLSAAIEEKMKLNRVKYPAEATRGHWSPPQERQPDKK